MQTKAEGDGNRVEVESDNGNESESDQPIQPKFRSRSIEIQSESEDESERDCEGSSNQREPSVTTYLRKKKQPEADNETGDESDRSPRDRAKQAVSFLLMTYQKSVSITHIL